jgi:hypothetical protein
VSAILEPRLEVFGPRLRRALARPEGRSLATYFTAPLVTALVVDFTEASFNQRLGHALPEVRDALERVGVPRGRQFVLVGGEPQDPGPQGSRLLARMREALSLPVFMHDPARSFAAGRTPAGVPIELDDELREAEAIVCVGECRWSWGTLVRGGPFMLVPGVASLATRQAFEARRAESGHRGAVGFALAAESLAPVDLAVTWDAMGGHVRAGRGRTQFAALARALRFF